jgi:hypothetical protein
MLRTTETQISSRACVRWIGGGSGAGKSTIARRLAEMYGFRLYHCDDVQSAHTARSNPTDHPMLHAFIAMTMDERWVKRTPEEMLDTFHGFHGEGFGLVLEDLLVDGVREAGVNPASCHPFSNSLLTLLHTQRELLESVLAKAWNDLNWFITKHLNIFKALNELFQGNPEFQTGQRHPKADMDTVAKFKVRVGRAVDIKDVGIFPLLFIAVGRPEPREEIIPCRNALSTQFGILFHHSR